MATVGRYFPVTNAIASLYGVMLGHRGVTMWGIGGLVWVLVTAITYVIAGIVAFRIFERTTKVRGSLARY